MPVMQLHFKLERNSQYKAETRARCGLEIGGEEQGWIILVETWKEEFLLGTMRVRFKIIGH